MLTINFSIKQLNLPERSACVRGCHLHHGISHGEGTQKHREEKESHVEVSGGGDSKEIAGWLVEEVDRESSAVEEKNTLEEPDAREEGAE